MEHEISGGVAAKTPPQTKVDVYIIRDPQGNPRFDDIFNVPQVVIDSENFTQSDLDYLNKLRKEAQ